MTWSPHTSVDLSEVKCAVTIVSDSLFAQLEQKVDVQDKDRSGQLALEILGDYGVAHSHLEYLPDRQQLLVSQIEQNQAQGYDFILFIGGTGLAKRDVTYEAVKSLKGKEVVGFGEEFRRQSIASIGPFGMLSRAIAMVYHQSVIVALPGSPAATELGLKTFLPVFGHLLQLLRK